MRYFVEGFQVVPVLLDNGLFSIRLTTPTGVEKIQEVADQTLAQFILGILAKAESNVQKLEFDLGDLEFFNSVGFRALIDISGQPEFLQKNVPITVVNAKPSFLRDVEITGTESLFKEVNGKAVN